jgi:hypothetical protein
LLTCLSGHRTTKPRCGAKTLQPTLEPRPAVLGRNSALEDRAGQRGGVSCPSAPAKSWQSRPDPAPMPPSCHMFLPLVDRPCPRVQSRRKHFAAWLTDGAWLCLGVLALREVLVLIGKVGGDAIGSNLLSFYPGKERCPFFAPFPKHGWRAKRDMVEMVAIT